MREPTTKTGRASPGRVSSLGIVRVPDQLTPLRYLLALVRTRGWLAASAVLFGGLWLVPGALLPLLVGHGIDDGIAAGDSGTITTVVALIIGIGVVQAAFGTMLEFLGHGMWIHGAQTTQRLVSEHTARLGHSLHAQAATGDVLAVSSSDINHIGNAFEVIGRFVGSLVAFAVLGTVLVNRSPLLGLVILIGVPLAVAGLGPLLAPLQRRHRKKRAELSSVNALAADIVSGLRILRGVGGERQFADRFHTASQRVRRSGVDVARGESWLAGAEALLPGLVLVTVTWLGARLAVAGAISVGELVAFYGASAFLVIPVGVATETASAVSSALVSARKVCGVLRLRPLLAEPTKPVSLPDGPLELHDSDSGLRAPAGKLTVIADEAGELGERLARFSDPAPGQWVSAGGTTLDRVPTRELRQRIVYAHSQDIWFSGVLRDQLEPPRERVVDTATALWAADADDIVAGLPEGLDELLGERGREVSGGQRQRLNLARALAMDPDVLLLDDPTSAVDAHTEARISRRVAELRSGRTTVVFSRSPLWRSVATAAATEAAAETTEGGTEEAAENVTDGGAAEVTEEHAPDEKVDSPW